MIVKDIAEYEETDSQLSKDTILRLHKEIEELKDLCDKYEEEHRTTFEEWKKTINILKDIKSQLDYLETYSSKEDVFEDMKRRLDRIESIVNGSDKE